MVRAIIGLEKSSGLFRELRHQQIIAVNWQLETYGSIEGAYGERDVL